MKRALWETLVELMDACGLADADDDAAPGLVRVTGFQFDLPVEVGLRRTGEGLEVLTELPRWRWTTAFDEQRARLKVTCREGEMP